MLRALSDSVLQADNVVGATNGGACTQSMKSSIKYLRDEDRIASSMRKSAASVASQYSRKQ